MSIVCSHFFKLLDFILFFVVFGGFEVELLVLILTASGPDSICGHLFLKAGLSDVQHIKIDPSHEVYYIKGLLSDRRVPLGKHVKVHGFGYTLLKLETPPIPKHRIHDACWIQVVNQRNQIIGIDKIIFDNIYIFDLYYYIYI